MSRPLSRPEATAARLQHEADQWAACWIAVTGHEQPVGDQRTAPWSDAAENAIDAHVAHLDDHDPGDDRHMQDRYDNWLERETP